MQKYAKICINMQPKYAQICKNMQIKYAKICKKYAKIYKSMFLHMVHLYALPTLLMMTCPFFHTRLRATYLNLTHFLYASLHLTAIPENKSQVNIHELMNGQQVSHIILFYAYFVFYAYLCIHLHI